MTPLTDARVLELARKTMPGACAVLTRDELCAFASAVLAEAAGHAVAERLPVPDVIEWGVMPGGAA